MASVGTETMGRRFFPRLHWGAIIAGTILALAVHIVMGLIGATLGFAAAPADSEALGAGAAAWALLTPFVASLLGAWLAIRLAGEEDKAGAYVHGVLVWCLGLIAGAVFLTGTLASGAMSAGTAASGNLGAAQRMVGVEPGATRGTPQAEAREDQAGKAGAAATGGAALAAIAGLLGAIVGSGLGLRREDRRGLGWRIAIQRRDERGLYAGSEGRGYGPGMGTTTGAGYAEGEQSRVVREGTRPEDRPSTDPYHH